MREHVWAIEYVAGGGLDGTFYRCHGCGPSGGPVPADAPTAPGPAWPPFLAGWGLDDTEFSSDCEVAAQQVAARRAQRQQALDEVRAAVRATLDEPWIVVGDRTRARWQLAAELVIEISNRDHDQPGGVWQAWLCLDHPDCDTGVLLGEDQDLAAVRRVAEFWVAGLRQRLGRI
jgi:hypothetical protein